MKQRKKSYMSLLDRERFQISRDYKPSPSRSEKFIGDIIAEIQDLEPKEDFTPYLLQERWTSIVGEQISKHTQPICLRGETLTIYADHPGWLSQVRRIPTPHLIKKISLIPEAHKVTKIYFKLDPSLSAHRNANCHFHKD